MAEVLRVEDLYVRFSTKDGEVKAVNGVSFALREESILCLVGESDAGKSTTALALLGLPPDSAKVLKGKVHFEGLDLLTADSCTLRQIRGKEISLVPQEPRASLNPTLTIGDQVEEQILAHTDVSRQQANALALDDAEGGGPTGPQRHSQAISLSSQRWHVLEGNALHGPGATAKGTDRRRAHLKP